MKKYKLIIKSFHSPKLQSVISVYNSDIEKVLHLIKQCPFNYSSVLKQALLKKHEILIQIIIDALLENKLVSSKKRAQKFIENNGYAILTNLASFGRTNEIFRLLKILPLQDQTSKTLILNLITIAAINGHSNAVGKLVTNLFPKEL